MRAVSQKLEIHVKFLWLFGGYEELSSWLNNATSLSFAQQTRHAQVATVNGWRPRLWRRRTSPVERSAGVRHLSEYTSNLQETFENTPV